MPASTPAASDAARALVRARWDRVTDPAARKAATVAATEARIRGAIERKVTDCLAVAPSWTQEQREALARALQGPGRK
jgi:hypothetical protein